ISPKNNFAKKEKQTKKLFIFRAFRRRICFFPYKNKNLTRNHRDFPFPFVPILQDRQENISVYF
ncbi:MAG: hypothetical protein J6I95_05195, partial [Anaerotignum sp.]|nr:hypothetical protein [Anaerotignum sp.]